MSAGLLGFFGGFDGFNRSQKPAKKLDFGLSDFESNRRFLGRF
jgi:hypothetical protein